MGKLGRSVRDITGKNNLFVRIFTGLILMSLSLVLFLGFWMNNISGRNYREQVALSNLSRLRQADEAIGLITEVLSQSMAQVMWGNDFITYLVSPGRVAPERDYRIIRQLDSIVSGSGLVRNAFLYCPLTGKIYDGASIYEAEEFGDWPVLQEHLQEYLRDPGAAGRRSDTMTATAMVTYGGRLLVIQDLDIASHIGTLVYEVNVRALSDMLGLKDPSGQSEIYIYNEAEEGILNGLLSYDAITPDWENGAAFIDSEHAGTRAGRQISGFYRYDSPERGWIYLMPLDTGSLTVKFRDILPMYLMAAAIFLVFSIAFDFYISHSIYRPINRLMKLVTQWDGRQKASGDGEIDFLEGAYSDAMDGQSQLKGLISNIAPEILDSMMKNLLVGKTLEEQRVAEILEGVGNPVEVHGRFLVLACQMTEPKEREVTDVELNLHLLSIRKLLTGLETPDYRVYDIRTEKLTVALVMGFPPDYPVVAIKKEYARISQLLEQLGQRIPYGLQVERGNIYQNIMDIRNAYHEALAQLQYQQYLESSEETESEESGEDADQIVNRRYIKERTKLLTEQAAQGKREDSETLIGQILEDLRSGELSPEEFRNMAEVFLDELTEKLVSLPLGEEEQALLESAHTAAEAAKQKSREELAEGVAEYARMAAGLLHTYGKKNSCKYVKMAKEYISQNYADSSLSLGDVCEHIGISASYLSELFNEVSGEKFSSYLACFRVEKAKQLLRTTGVTIKEIGFRCGFNSIQNFIRVFKKYTDRTPGHYREGQS